MNEQRRTSASMPYGPNIKRLQGYEPLTWRHRAGDHRIFYLIDEEEKMVFVLTIDDRTEA